MSLAAAEDALDMGDIKRSVETAMGAYKLALTRWRSLTKRPERRWDNRPHDEQSLRIRTLEAISEANSFAVDGGEADWFSRALTEGLSANMSQFFDRDDAERVLSFAFTWILGFERASQTWVPDRHLRAATVARNVRTGDARVGIDSFTLGDSDRSVTFVLSNVPPEAEYMEWAHTLQGLLGIELGQYQWKVRQDGTVNVLRMTGDADDLVNDARRLVTALAEVETTALAKSRAEVERVERSAVRAKQLDDSLASLSFPTWVEQIRWDGLQVASTGGWVIHTVADVEGLQLAGDKDLYASIASQPMVEMCAYRGTRQLAIAPLLEGAQLHHLLWVIDPLVQSALGRKKETDRVKRADEVKLRQRIEDLFASAEG